MSNKEFGIGPKVQADLEKIAALANGFSNVGYVELAEIVSRVEIYKAIGIPGAAIHVYDHKTDEFRYRDNFPTLKDALRAMPGVVFGKFQK